MKAMVVKHEEAILQDLGGGQLRRILAHTPELMLVEITFPAGAVGALHTHPHVQSSYVRSGRFLFTVDGEEVEVQAGDSLVFPSGIPHGVLCVEAGVLVDTFTPQREDFLK